MHESDKVTILVVDDIPENIQLLAEILSPTYRVKATTSGEKALSIAQSFPLPEIILLDIIMPVMDGYTVCGNLKENPKTSKITVILLLRSQKL